MSFSSNSSTNKSEKYLNTSLKAILKELSNQLKFLKKENKLREKNNNSPNFQISSKSSISSISPAISQMIKCRSLGNIRSSESLNTRSEMCDEIIDKLVLTPKSLIEPSSVADANENTDLKS